MSAPELYAQYPDIPDFDWLWIGMSLGFPSIEAAGDMTRVYFIGPLAEGPIKIGKSNDPVKRLKVLQTASAYELHILLTVRCRHDVEGMLHRMLRRHRTFGEWFERDAVERVMDLLRPLAGADGNLSEFGDGLVMHLLDIWTDWRGMPKTAEEIEAAYEKLMRERRRV